jgi:hypothetical protein
VFVLVPMIVVVVIVVVELELGMRIDVIPERDLLVLAP